MREEDGDDVPMGKPVENRPCGEGEERLGREKSGVVQ